MKLMAARANGGFHRWGRAGCWWFHGLCFQSCLASGNVLLLLDSQRDNLEKQELSSWRCIAK